MAALNWWMIFRSGPVIMRMLDVSIGYPYCEAHVQIVRENWSINWRSSTFYFDFHTLKLYVYTILARRNIFHTRTSQLNSLALRTQETLSHIISIAFLISRISTLLSLRSALDNSCFFSKELFFPKIFKMRIILRPISYDLGNHDWGVVDAHDFETDPIGEISR